MSNSRHEVIREVWDKHEDENWRMDQSHWRGKGRWVDDNRWQAIGKRSVASLRALWKMVGKPYFPEPLSCLEWGPGGGTNLFAMRRHCRVYYGVDISPSNLAECGRMIGAEGHGDLFRPVLLEAEPAKIADLIKEPIDVFLSTAVFQHFPSKDYGAEVLQAVRSVSHKETVGFVQIRYDNGNEKFKPISDLSEYKEKHITANSYQIDEFWNLLRTCGFDPLMVRDINTQVNYATFYFKRSA